VWSNQGTVYVVNDNNGRGFNFEKLAQGETWVTREAVDQVRAQQNGAANPTYSQNVPSDLRALAQRVMELDAGVTRVLVCNDARMHEVYWGCFERLAPEGLAAAAQDEQIGKPAAVTLPASWSGVHRAVHAAGSGFAAYPELRSVLAGHLDRVHDGLLPRAAEIVRLAAREVAGGRVLPAEQALPVYLRDDVAHATGGGH